MRKTAGLVCLGLFLYCGAALASAQASNQDWNRDPAQESPEQARMEAQDPDTKASAGDLAKAAESPESGLISVALESETAFDIGPYGRNENGVLHFEPSIPVRLSENWKMITRTIGALVDQPEVNKPRGGTFGLTDLSGLFFLSPVKPHRLSWGVGPAVLVPTASADVLGTKKFCVGPAVMVVVEPGNWTLGVVASNRWSVAGRSTSPNVNSMMVEYFIDYNLKKGWYLTSEQTAMANWRASSGNVLLVPMGGGLGKVVRLGFQPMSVSVQAYTYVTHPNLQPSPSWQLKFLVSLLFPGKVRGQ
jgi:hypothetical protein